MKWIRLGRYSGLLENTGEEPISMSRMRFRWKFTEKTWFTDVLQNLKANQNCRFEPGDSGITEKPPKPLEGKERQI